MVKEALVLRIAAMAASGAAIVFATLWYSQSTAAEAAISKVARLEANLRTKTQKVFQMEEDLQEQIDAARNEQGMALWNAKVELETCLKGKK